MLANKFLRAALTLQHKHGMVLVGRTISSTPQLMFRTPPPMPVASEEGENFDPKTQSLEEFLNVRFGPTFPTINDDKNPMRDVKNFPRLAQPDFCEPTRLGIIPESWMNFFHEKTGVTGPYVFLGSFLTFLLSKEWLVFEHELLVGIEATVIIVALVKMLGPNVRQSSGIELDKNMKEWDDWQNGMIEFLEKYIHNEMQARESPKHHKILFDAKRENIQLQLEAEYRRRQMQAYQEVKRRLDFLVAKDEAMKLFQQRYMVDWIIDGVAKSITPQQEKEALKTTLSDLKKMAANVSL